MGETTGAPSLLVFEFDGEARGGKGTITDYLAAKEAIAKDETGIDYRFLTKALLERSLISSTMTSEEIATSLSGLSSAQLADILAGRIGRNSERLRAELYDDDINQLVPDVSQIPHVRIAVKAGFASRLEAIRDSGRFIAVVIDGRNLAKVAENISGVRMALRIFVECSPFEAALRECARDNVDINSSAGRDILASIKLRNQKDRSRSIDPMVADSQAIDFWQGSRVDGALKELRSADSMEEYLSKATSQIELFDDNDLPHGIGQLAAKSACQIRFDTTAFRLFKNSKASMLTAAEQMFNEALSGF